jgi:alkanesulfonate monooxygenase SsuD/methylene tetrahydromethanopterin reductase-like flavin-dependent oxidoreductase (luciferase family)
VNVPNFGPGTGPGVLRSRAQTVEGLGFDLLMVSDHIAVTPDVAEQYPAPFYEPFTTLAWLAGITSRVRLGTTMLIVPYRHPLLIARMAANLNQLSGGRLVLGVGAGWARQEFEALGVPFRQRGSLTPVSTTHPKHVAHLTCANLLVVAAFGPSLAENPTSATCLRRKTPA